MDILPRLLATASVIAVILMVGCVPGLRSTKSPPTANQPADRAKANSASALEKPSEKPSLDKENLLAPPPPPGTASSLTGARMPTVKSSDLVDKEEVGAAALLFAQGVPNAKHVKTCYSKVAGGWSLFIYVEKGKKFIEQEYARNKENREWEFYAA